LIPKKESKVGENHQLPMNNCLTEQEQEQGFSLIYNVQKKDLHLLHVSFNQQLAGV